MVSSDPSDAAIGTLQPSSDFPSRKRVAEDSDAAESAAAKKAAVGIRGQLTMRRSGTTTGFHGPTRPNVAAGQHSPFPQRASHSRPVSAPGPLSLPTPTKFDFTTGQSSTARGLVLSPDSSSASSFSSAPTPIANFQLSTEVRQSLSRTAAEALDSTSRLPLQISRPVVARAPQPPQRSTPQVGPVHRLPPESDDEERETSDSDDQPLANAKDQSPTFEDRICEAQEHSEVWNYIKDKIQFVNFTCKSDREVQAMLEILRLPKQNDLDDEPMREAARHQRRYNVVMASILQVVGARGYCDACGPHCRKHWEHRKKTCTSLPPEATGPGYRDLVDFVSGRCSNCIRSNSRSSSCHFAAGDAPVDAQAEEVSSVAADHTSGNKSSQNRAHSRGSQNRAHSRGFNGSSRRVHLQPRALASNPQTRAPIGSEQNGARGHAEAIIRDAISVGYRASTQLQPQEQRGFHNWLTALLSFSSSSPGLEDQALAAFARLRQLDPDFQADIRRRILQMLPGAMDLPA